MDIKAKLQMTGIAKATINKVIVLDSDNVLQIIGAKVQQANDFADEAERWAIGEIADLPAGSAKYWAQLAQGHNQVAKASADNATTSAATAITKANEASASATNAKTSETNAKSSEIKSQTAEINAKASESAALLSKNAAAVSATNAKTSESNAKTSEIASLNSKNAASVSTTTAMTKATEANASKEDARKWAIGSTIEQPAGSAKYWAEQAKAVSNITDATEEAKGIIRIATATEVVEGLSTNTAITPKALNDVVTSLPAGGGGVISSPFNAEGHLVFPDGSEFWIE